MGTQQRTYSTMKLINLILTLFETNWLSKVSILWWGQVITYKQLIKEVFVYYRLITKTLVYRDNLTYAIYASNSMEYIACYLALILKNVNFYLIPKDFPADTVNYLISNAHINVLFISHSTEDKKLLNRIKNLPYFLLCINIQNKTYPIQKIETELDVVVDMFTPISIAEEWFKYPCKNKNRSIGVFTNGTSSLYPKVIYFDDDTILKGLLKLSDSRLTPMLSGKKVYSEISFAYAHVWTILLPLYEGAIFCFTDDIANVVIHSNYSFEEIWNNASENIYEKRWIGKLLLKHRLEWLFKFFIKKELKRYFNSITQKKAIIVLNASLPSRIIKTIVKSLPIYTTYGIQEANQIVAINNYSTKLHTQEGCVGEVLDNIGVSLKLGLNNLNEGSLVLVSDHISKELDMEKDVFYDTRDHSTITNLGLNRNLLFVYGKMRNTIKGSITKGGNIEIIERILKNIPYFKDVLITKFNDDYVVLIQPNSNIIEIKGIGLIDFNNHIKQYKSVLNDKFGSDFVSHIKIIPGDFKRTHTGSIKRLMYQLDDILPENL